MFRQAHDLFSISFKALCEASRPACASSASFVAGHSFSQIGSRFGTLKELTSLHSIQQVPILRLELFEQLLLLAINVRETTALLDETGRRGFRLDLTCLSDFDVWFER